MCIRDSYGRCEAVSDGRITPEAEALNISGASRVTLYLICTTDYQRLMWSEGEGLPGQEAEQCFADQTFAMLRENGEMLRALPYETIRSFHREDVSRLMSRMEIELHGEKGGEAAALFQYGRYLLLSSSREDSALPAHLQGIWNDDVAVSYTHLDVYKRQSLRVTVVLAVLVI